MTKIDGFGNRYKLANSSFQIRGMVVVHRNNEKGYSQVKKEDWDKWEEVADSDVEQTELEL